MHELALAASIVEIVGQELSRRHLQRAREVRVAVGAFAGVEPDALQFCFDVVAKGTAVDGSTLTLESIEPRGTCLTCQRGWRPHTLYERCAHCGGAMRVENGLELRVTSFDV